MAPNDSEQSSNKTNQRAAARHRRANATRRRALSPVRIILMILMLPATTAAIAVGVFLRTSEFEHQEALLHLIALAGCHAAEALVPGPYRDGEPGYHARNDTNGDGIACGTAVPQYAAPKPAAAPQPVEAPQQRQVGTAKFVRP
ncbi:excalibur calcium-binding domain-containing protein [Ruegeria atlantica]|uniref:excalibur calcium-binding domain-containing protein n=1 Tax=Ruegeria atlantica TaxID=81569 RepID=UPI00147A1812|nr:excalibur calcium-binding domain-containing protein [Ruegeria atlantica]